MNAPTPQANSSAERCDGADSLGHIEHLVMRCHAPMATLRLAAFAADALRVLRALEHHADMSKVVDDTIKSSCSDWRNPCSTVEPLDLISTSLFFAWSDLDKLLRALESTLTAVTRVAPPAP